MVETKEDHKKSAANREYDINLAAAWMHVKLCEALVLAEGRLERWKWSQKYDGVLDS